MTGRVTAPASLPPAGLPGLDPQWSRLVQAHDAAGVLRTWHVLDTLDALDGREPRGTLLCVHGNPTWSYRWRSLLAQAPEGWRVVAVDHLGMGFSERTDTFRRLADRISDLGALTDALAITGPVVTVAHDWGGAISLGWALEHRDQLAGIVLTNTAVSQPPGSPVPGLIALARTPGVLRASTVRTPAFLNGTLRLARTPLEPDVRAAYQAPYRTAARRVAIGDFVDDIPLTPEHPSYATLDGLASGLGLLADVPVLLLWGPSDPVFSDRYLRDLIERLPQAQVHRYEGAGHLVIDDRDLPAAIVPWLARLGDPSASAAPDPVVDLPVTDDHRLGGRLWAALDDRSEDRAAAVVELGDHARTVSFATLSSRVRDLAAGLVAAGVRPGDRVALLVPPGADLTATVYACWRMGAVVVIADAGLGVKGLTRALRGAGPKHLVGIPRAIAAARVLRWPGRVIAAGPITSAAARALGADRTLADVARQGVGQSLPPEPGLDDEAAILFTSGATGPAKGVVYTHRQLQAQREAIRDTYAVTSADRLVAAFAPFALYGPALGITSAVPDMDVTAPGTLTAAALAEAVAAVDATLVFGSPAALVNVVATAEGVPAEDRAALGRVRLLLSAGAPVPASLLRAVSAVLPNAEPHTPYGMTEALPVADITLAEIESVGSGVGVCVGFPLTGVEVSVDPLDATGQPVGEQTAKSGVTGEICVHAAHVKDHYDRLWLTESASHGEPGWHRTGDVGHLDDDGRLWVEGRLAHVVTTAQGVRTPVGIEQQVEQLPGVSLAAAVGVGPIGTQALVLVLATEPPARRAGLADGNLTDAVRVAAGGDVAAVLVVAALPVDLRHNSKIDRTRVARWATRVLAGERRPGRP